MKIMIDVLGKDDHHIEVDIACDGDGCDEELLAAEFDNWSEMIQELKDDGWRIWRSGDTWYHFCKKCK